MHISDGVLGTPVVAATSVAAAGLVAYSLKGTKEKEIPRIALMSAVFFVGSLVHINVGGSSVHLILSGIIGLVLGRRTPIAISIALLFQMLLFQFGGLSSYGANIIDVSVPAMIMAWLIKPILGKDSKRDFLGGFLAGSMSVALTIVFVSVMLIESNMRFGFGPFSSINGLMIGHIPIMLGEGIVTGFAVRMIMKTRPDIIGLSKK